MTDAPDLHVEKRGPTELRDPLIREEMKKAGVWLGLALAIILIALLAQPLQRLGGRQGSIPLRPLPQPEDSLPEQGLGPGDAIRLHSFQPDQTPLATMGERPAQGARLDGGHEAPWSPDLTRGSNMRSPI